MKASTRPSRIVGILGGMGPAATVDFYDKLVRATPVSSDQEHLRVVIWADPTVPNRHEALLAGGEDPTPWLEAGVRHLMRCGAQILVVPCNTVHAYMPTVIADEDVEFLSIIDEAVDGATKSEASGRIGLLAADGALASGLYQSALGEVGIEPVLPSQPSQQALMRLIHAVKSGRAGVAERDLLVSLITELQHENVSTVIAACTEISVLTVDMDAGVRIIDPSQLLARRTVERARSRD